MKKGIFFREDSVWRKRLLQSIPVITGLFVVANGHADPITTIDSKLIVQQTSTITGKVLDSNGEALIGVNVLEKGTTNGTITDFNGNFTLNLSSSNSTLVFSYIGYVSQEISAKGKKDFTITLKEDSETLEEVVVVGYGTQKKVNLTGSVSSVSAKDIQDVPTSNTASLLQGRMPGLVISQNGGQAGKEDMEVRVRGVGTFGNNNPMVLIDGVEGTLSQMSDIPAADIENISVLKDAASAAIYGVRAANGVILITTKKGKAGKISVNYSGSYTLQKPMLPTYIDSYQWALMKNDVAPDTYDATALQKLQDGSDPDHYANTNWLDEVFRNASMHQHHLSVSGGNEHTQYMTSISYSNQEGIMKKTGAEKFSFRSNVDSNIGRFNFGLNVSGNKNNVDQPASIAPSGETSVMRYLSWFSRPTVPVKYSNGYYGYVDGSLKNAELVKNPLQFMEQGYRLDEAWRFNGKAYAGIDIIDGLKFKTSLAYAFYMNATKKYTPKELARYDAEGNILKAAGQNNRLEDYYWREATWTNENILTYDKKFGLHNLNVLLGHSLISYTRYTTTAGIEGFPTENIYEMDGGSKNPSAVGNSDEYRLQSFFGRINYSYADKYLLEVNVRHDGSSRMPKNNRYATFPSVSAGWVFTNESFMENYQWLFGKLRFSWGKLGNQEIDSYAYLASLGASGNYYFDQSKDPQTGMVSTSIPNENIKWETTRTLNVAIDLGFLNNKIQTTFEWFDKKTSDILMQLAMPNIFLGSLSAPYQNVGTVRNRGWEWNVNYNDSKGDWSWYAGFNLSHVNNKILYMGGLDERISGQTINRVGEPIGAYYAYQALGLYRTEEDLNRTNSKGEVIKQNGVAPKLGDIMYADLNDDGNITPEDRTIIGNPFPKYSYGINLGASWKGFDLSTFWQGVAGIYRYNWETTTDIRGNFTDRWLDRWSTDNPNGKMPALGNTMNEQFSSFWLENASYLRLKNFEFGYTFGNLPKIGVSKLRIYFAGTNLLTFTKLDNWDPEKGAGDTRNDNYPNAKSFSFGINVTF